MERPFTFGPSLFKAVDGTKISFHLRRCDNESEIREYIENGGGAVVDQFVSQRDPFTITLEDAMNSSAPPKGRDTFRPEFIIKCCARNKLVPLKPFSNNASKFSNEFDPNDVLLHKISWSEASKFCLEETNAHAKKYQITKATGPRRKSMVECLLKQDRKSNGAREQEEMAELKSRHERNENASEGMIQGTCEVVDVTVQGPVKVDVAVQTSPVKIRYPSPHQ